MTAWSRTEASRTIEEARRRSALDPGFRALALSDAAAALARINPRPIPPGSIVFVEIGGTVAEIGPNALVIELPDLGQSEDELSIGDLEKAAGGSGGPSEKEQR